MGNRSDDPEDVEEAFRILAESLPEFKMEVLRHKNPELFEIGKTAFPSAQGLSIEEMVKVISLLNATAAKMADYITKVVDSDEDTPTPFSSKQKVDVDELAGLLWDTTRLLGKLMGDSEDQYHHNEGD